MRVGYRVGATLGFELGGSDARTVGTKEGELVGGGKGTLEGFRDGFEECLSVPSVTTQRADGSTAVACGPSAALAVPRPARELHCLVAVIVVLAWRMCRDSLVARCRK